MALKTLENYSTLCYRINIRQQFFFLILQVVKKAYVIVLRFCGFFSPLPLLRKRINYTGFLLISQDHYSVKSQQCFIPLWSWAY